MQKVVKLVIKTCLFFLFSSNINGQTINDNYLLLNKVIKLTKTKPDSTYKLLKSVNSNKDKLEKYYKFRYYNKPIYKVLIDYDEKKDSLIYDNVENQKKRERIWSLKYKILDSLFTKKDIEYFLEQDKLWLWNNNNLSNNVYLSEDTGWSFGNIIYKPYFSLNGKYALVQHASAKKFTSFYIFSKKSDEWIFIDSIVNIW